MSRPTALVLGAGGFIGSHMVKRLKSEGYWVRGVDLKYPEFAPTAADHFVIGDLRDPNLVSQVVAWAGVNRNPYQTFAMQHDQPFDEIYQFAADMGGAGFIFTGLNDADIMHNSAAINLHLLDAVVHQTASHKPKIFYSSSACVYPAYNQVDPANPRCDEPSAYPAEPDSDYGWEKLFGERLFLAYSRNYQIPVRVARYHNVFGPEGTWQGGREKAPAAICRKVALAESTIEVWGDGSQTRSFLYIDECIEGTRRLMSSDFEGPVNVGSNEMISIGDLTKLVCSIAGKDLQIVHVPGPVGVAGRNSDNRLIAAKLGWEPLQPLATGLSVTYKWIQEQIANSRNNQ